MLEKFDFNRGTHIRMSWLQNRYEELVTTQMYEAAIRVYMLHQVACSLFAVSQVFIPICGTCGCLVAMTLGFGVQCVNHPIFSTWSCETFKTRQLAGYLSLLQVYLKFLLVV